MCCELLLLLGTVNLSLTLVLDNEVLFTSEEIFLPWGLSVVRNESQRSYKFIWHCLLIKRFLRQNFRTNSPNMKCFEKIESRTSLMWQLALSIFWCVYSEADMLTIYRNQKLTRISQVTTSSVLRHAPPLAAAWHHTVSQFVRNNYGHIPDREEGPSLRTAGIQMSRDIHRALFLMRKKSSLYVLSCLLAAIMAH